MFSPLVRHKRLVAELRTLRDQAGMTSDQLAKAIGQSRMKISRLENAAGRPNVPDVMRILDALQVAEPHWSRLVSLAGQATEHGWWESFGEHMGARQQAYANLEFGAVTVREYQNNAIPGLLQTAEYRRGREDYTTIERPAGGRYDAEKSVEARMFRQRVLFRPGGPRYEAIIEEAVVRRPTAPPAAMHEQLERLAMASNDQVCVRILPVDSAVDGYWFARSPFSLYNFPDPDDPDVVAIDTETQDLIFIEAEPIAHYQVLYQRLHEAALSPEDSSKLLMEAAQRFAHSD